MGRPPLPPPPLLDPAWYPDPTGRYEARYWDGRKWTSHISHYGATGADPLVRARFDRWWIRGFFRIASWVLVIGVGYWAYQTYWPDNERDLEADEALASASVLNLADLPSGAWQIADVALVSPLTLEFDDDGVPTLPACVGLEGSIGDVEDEPRRQNGFASVDGLATIAHATTVGDGTGFGRGYLDDLRLPEAGPCLTALWEASASGDVTVSEVTEMSAAYGDDAVWWRLIGEDTSGAFGRAVTADVVVVRVDAVVVEYVFTADIEPLGVDVQRDIINLELARIRELIAARDAEDSAEDSGEDSAEDGAEDGGSDAEAPADGLGTELDGASTEADDGE